MDGVDHPITDEPPTAAPCPLRFSRSGTRPASWSSHEPCIGHGYRLLSSGGTGAALAAAGIPFTEVSAYTGSPEMMGGRVKTLHPRVHGGLLGRRGIDDAVMAEHGIEPIDLLVVNLYPFEAMRERDLPLAELVEFIDIGGPAMIRAAAKNFRDVAVVVDPSLYPLVLAALDRGGFTDDERLALARAAFARTAEYDAAISNHLYALDGGFPTVYTRQWTNGRPLRYGENPHQQAAVYGDAGIAGAVPLQGREMSYNNYLDLDAAVRLVREFDDCAAVVVKHNNPCGAAVGATSGRGLRHGARGRPGLGLRRRGRAEPAG